MVRICRRLDDGHLDERVLRAVRIKAARTAPDSDVIEEALRRELGLDLLDRIWETADLEEDEALRLAVEAQHDHVAPSSVRVVLDANVVSAAFAKRSAGGASHS